MSYDPSHRKPPRQERWPQATPPDAWPSYRDDAYQDGEQADSRYAADRQGAYPATASYQHQVGYQGASGGPGDRDYQSAVATDTFPPARSGYGSAAGYGQADGYGDARDGSDWTGNGGNGSDWTENGYGAAGNANGNGYIGAGNGHSYSYSTGAFPSAGYAGGINGYAGAADDFAEAVNGYGGLSTGYAGTADGYTDAAGGYPGAADSYADAGDSFAGGPDPFSRMEGGYGQATDEYVSDGSGYDWSENVYGSATDGYGGATNGYAGAPDGYGGAVDGYGGAVDGYGGAVDGYGEGPDGFAGSAGYLGPGSYTESGFSDPTLMAPDAGVDPDRWQADQDLRREAGQRGLVVGAVTGLLAAAVAIGVSTLAAAFVRPQASPMGALGDVFIDRMPAALRNAAVQHFGTHGRTVLLLVMYAAIAVLAMGIGVLARHATTPGVAGLAAFSLIAAFVTITRPGGRVSDVAPAIIGGIAGVMALLWLMQASAPAQGPQRVPPLRQARGNGPRRAR